MERTSNGSSRSVLGEARLLMCIGPSFLRHSPYAVFDSLTQGHNKVSDATEEDRNRRSPTSDDEIFGRKQTPRSVVVHRKGHTSESKEAIERC
ncbi:hypothetical protein IQ06DRAFT_297041 [Phaeosphaeriaceae sp. SRC1lsM3a]|nr:hypothetical protein IQ06DRAFT_297041 [Stagonospora sp. SRC1lsM3a]